MAIALILVIVSLATLAACGGVTSPKEGDCLCFNKDTNLRNKDCRDGGYGTANRGECYKYTGSEKTCRGKIYYGVIYAGEERFASGEVLDVGDDYRCQDYTCDYSKDDLGKRIHEPYSTDSVGCVDSNCKDNCRGGKTDAYVKCRCTRNGKYLPHTRYWVPGEKVKNNDGTCNRDIPTGTAVCTFDDTRKYDGHDCGIYIGCTRDGRAQVYDQHCNESISSSRYGDNDHYFREYYTVRSARNGPDDIKCREGVAGRTPCKECYQSCKNC